MDETTPNQAPTSAAGETRPTREMIPLRWVVLWMIWPAIPAIAVGTWQVNSDAPLGAGVTALWLILAAIGLINWLVMSLRLMAVVTRTSTAMRVVGVLFLVWVMLLVNVSLLVAGVALIAGGHELWNALRATGDRVFQGG